VRHFETIEELRNALLAFRESYNTTWLIQRHGYLSPAAFRRNQLQPTAKAEQRAVHFRLKWEDRW
jgi:putative transposase